MTTTKTQPSLITRHSFHDEDGRGLLAVRYDLVDVVEDLAQTKTNLLVLPCSRKALHLGNENSLTLVQPASNDGEPTSGRRVSIAEPPRCSISALTVASRPAVPASIGVPFRLRRSWFACFGDRRRAGRPKHAVPDLSGHTSTGGVDTNPATASRLAFQQGGEAHRINDVHVMAGPSRLVSAQQLRLYPCSGSVTNLASKITVHEEGDCARPGLGPTGCASSQGQFPHTP